MFVDQASYKSIILVLYVDDSLIAARIMRTTSKFLSALKAKFQIREMGEPKHFLGMVVKYFQDQGVIALNQSKYVHLKTSANISRGLSQPLRLPRITTSLSTMLHLLWISRTEV